MSSLDLRAGPVALALLRQRGLRADDVALMVGASGGPKWLALVGLDSWLMGDFLPGRSRSDHLPLLGASIGSWRMACLATRDPMAARTRLLDAYLEQRYPANPTAAQVSAESRRMLSALLDGEDPEAMIRHPGVQLHILVAGTRGLVAGHQRKQVLAGLALAALRNVLSPRLLGRQFDRLVFHGHGRAPCTASWRDLPTRHLLLRGDILARILLASGSIPLLLESVRLPDYGEGVLYDGGILDYHPLPRGTASGLVLYPHFFPDLVPGWFDKALRWRHSPPEALSHTLLISPSASWVARLPGGRIPDRRDFVRMGDDERQRVWRRVVAESARLGEDMARLVERGTLDKAVRPL
jgi:hypothetical protein